LLKGRLVLEWSVIALVATLLVFAALSSGATRRFDNLLYDAASVWRAAPPSDKILIVAIDNQSLARIGKWQWPRQRHADLIARLAPAKPSAIAYDVMFLEEADDGSDTALAAAMTRDVPVLLPVLYETPGLNGADYDLYRPVPILAKAARNVGTVNLLFDSDGLVRRAQLETRTGDRQIPHLMEVTHRAVTGTVSTTYKNVVADNPGDRGPEAGTILIPFHAEGAFRSVSFSSVLAGEVPKAFFKDKIILVGATAPGLGDRFPVPGPAGSTMSGVEIQANMLNGLMNNSFVQTAPFWMSLLAGLVPIWLLLVSFLKFRPNRNLLVSMFLIVLVILLSLATVVFSGLWIPPGPALLGLILIYPLWGWRRLEALSSFVGTQAKALRAEPGLSSEWVAPATGLDSIAAEAAELQNVIGTLRSVQRFMSDVISGFPDAVCVVDHDNQITLTNEAGRDLLGPDVVGQKLSSVLMRQKQQDGPDDELTLDDGRTFLIRRVPLTLDKAMRYGAIVRFADITRLKVADRERAQVLEFLSHDMRTPQAAIISLLEQNGEKPAEPSMLARINGYARQTLKLADNFVHRARFASIKELKDDVNLSSVIAEAIDSCWSQAQLKKISVTATGLEIEAFIQGDASALTRAFINLIDNAIKYSPIGSHVTCALETESGSVLCTIVDQGPGLPQARLDDLFAAYGARGTQTVTGAGLGLAFVKAVADRHKAEVSCTSDSTGTRFALRFPLVEEE
jgi:CHASE2 domain-containing sensor protein/signal transduction histidine kinase